MNGKWALSGLVCLAAFGCGKHEGGNQEATPQPVATQPSAPETQQPATPASTPAPSKAPNTGLSFDSAPASLKNDAFHYYGLSSPKPKKYKIQFSNGPSSNQVVTMTATKIGDDKIEFEEDDDGSPSTVQTMSLDSTGIYVESIQPQVLKTPHFLELPSKLDAGSTWESHQSVNSGTESLDETLSYKVVGEKSVNTPAGTFQALYVVANGKGNLGSKPAQMKVESWYVKDLGLVKTVAQITGSGINSTIQQILIK